MIWIKVSKYWTALPPAHFGFFRVFTQQVLKTWKHNGDVLSGAHTVCGHHVMLTLRLSTIKLACLLVFY